MCSPGEEGGREGGGREGGGREGDKCQGKRWRERGRKDETNRVKRTRRKDR